jgi:hypothetical protein
MPSRIHQMDSRLSPPGAGLANGGPLSVRIASGKPYSRNTASKTARARSSSVRSTARQRNRKRLKASLVVNGSQRLPSPQRNQPL